jgi:hydrogenase maturation protease
VTCSGTRIIGLGNTILTDDGVGVYAARELARRLDAAAVDVIEMEVAGFDLLERLVGWRRVILVDAICFDDLPPGEVVRIAPSDLRTSLRIRSVHEIDLPTVLGLGRFMGMAMPEEVVIFGVQAADTCTLHEGLTPAVEEGMGKVVEAVLREVGE